MRANKTATVTDRKSTLERPTSDYVAATARVLVAVWCRSVGTSWTLELHEGGVGTAQGRVVDWISSGVPISQPEPDTLVRDLLAARRLHLFGDSSAGPGTHSRCGIGYVCENAELIKLAHLVADEAVKAGVHPVVLAKRWVAAGFSAEEAAGWIRQGAQSPQVAQHRP
ncbi:MAG: hypothetical protein WCF33_18435 [Pseudonocardiaceae bacterium]